MRQEIRWKCSLLILGILLLGILMTIGYNDGLGNRKEEETQQILTENHEEGELSDYKEEIGPEKEEEQDTNMQTVPIPVYNGTIRVLMKSSGYTSDYHEHIVLEGSGQSWVFENSDQGVFLNGEEMSETDFPIHLEEQEAAGYTITSLERAMGNPCVMGSLDVYSTEQGFVLVNEVDLETYLKYVVPSEMPASYELEALKAQAVCARTYAYSHTKAYAYPEYTAHVDDSVRFQVYQNQEAHKRTNQAVEETEGRIITYNNEPIKAYYFSTSWGHTTNEEIWMEGNVEATPYLKGRCMDDSGKTLDLSTDEAFLRFLKEPEADFYEDSVSWFRWSGQIDVETLSEHLNEVLVQRYEANPEAILTRKGGKFVCIPVKNIGTIKRIEIMERGEGGVIHKIQVAGTKRLIEISTEYNIRALLNMEGEILTRSDGSKVKGGSLLPSAYFAIMPLYEKEELVGYKLEGGGYGHGAGMSQNGANQMAKQGKTWEEILKAFYTDVELSDLADYSAI